MLEFDESDLTRSYPGYSQNGITNMEREWIKTSIWDSSFFLEEIGSRQGNHEADVDADGSSPAAQE